jgi:hypothetical protein
MPKGSLQFNPQMIDFSVTRRLQFGRAKTASFRRT